MTPKAKNALRRYHMERLKRRVAGYYGGYARDDPAEIGRLATTRTPCSCWMCRSPRYSFKGKGRLTRQEIRAAIDAREQLEAA